MGERSMNRQQESAYAGWLRYAPVTDTKLAEAYRSWGSELAVPGPLTEVLQAAAAELTEGFRSMLGRRPVRRSEATQPQAILLGVRGQSAEIDQALSGKAAVPAPDGYVIRTVAAEGCRRIVVAGESDKGALYAAFHLLRLMQNGETLEELDIAEAPANGLRMMNQWDNMDGSIERGYAGKSIFYADHEMVKDTFRVRDYARLLASVGINAISINNVNVHHYETMLISEKYLPDVARIAGVFRAFGIVTYLSINYASPIQLGGLATADPLDEEVKAWWQEKAEAIYRHIPDFGGFLVKADSEFRPGPFTYGRDHADGANVLADALQPYGGIVIWRCFVYDCLQDWRDRKTDRARAAYDHFTPLDGRFRDNVILQIKNGPMDFQVREPVSPLFGALPNTNQVLELQVTQEYTGQQKHVCFLVPQWKEVLEFDTYARGEGSTVAEIASGKLFGRRLGGIAAVSNIGDDLNWTGHILAQANLYGYGRLTWNPGLSSEQIVQEWVSMTFGCDPQLVSAISRILLDSWEVYESYTAPLGVGWMVNPNHHYGPNVDGYEYSKWGTYHFADLRGIGVDRTVQSGTGYTAQYQAPNAGMYESLETCPDELLLFFHHVPYTHKLQSGKTVIQHIYDTHFEGAARAEQFVSDWSALEGRIETDRFSQVLARLQDQADHAKEWRDQINTYFFRKSGIADERGREIY
ncbi:alpha-glucuronidase [Paenibacillus sp. N4]|nr:alpha-glucuronidase family glycosyl hydrolase [Paenibacillus vietnamensis]MCA0755959.1 alpha-glucuronidase [Paenibacillus vietnamensis]